MFNPYINSKKYIYTYFAVWITLFFSNIVFVSYYNGIPGISFAEFNFRDYLVDELTHDICIMFLAISFWYPAQYIRIESNSFIKIILKHLVIALLANVIWLGISYFIVIDIFTISDDYKVFFERTYFYRFFGGIFAYIIITLINYLVIYYNLSKDKQIVGAQLESMLKEAELKTLKYQINPHFIFNSLNSISSLTLTAPEKAREMTIKLSEFLRGTLSKNDKQLVSLKEELKNIALYLDIEKIRFQDKFEYLNTIDEKWHDIKIPAMIFQPLFENAIKHGVYESLEKVIIQLRAEESGNYLKIDLLNNYDSEAISPKGEGIGISNIKNRLKLVYNQDNLLSISDNKEYFQVTIYIPLER